MNDGQQHWMATHIARGLEQLGLEVTPRSIEHGFAVLGASFRTTEKRTPPDPYAAGLARLRRQLPRPVILTNGLPPAYAHVDKHGVPDVYAAALAKMKTENNR